MVARYLTAPAAHPGHVFNFGHGIAPEIDPAHLGVLIDAVHELSKRTT